MQKESQVLVSTSVGPAAAAAAASVLLKGSGYTGLLIVEVRKM